MSDEPAVIGSQSEFRIVKKIASGGMGNIYLAEQIGVHGFRKIVALKRILKELLEDSETIQLFLDEAKLVADLIHENIVQVYHLDQLPSGEFLIVMEYVPSRNLAQVIDRLRSHQEKTPINLTAFVVSRVCRGLAYAHRKRDHEGRRLKIVHRDVSPSNVLISFNGVVKLVDFGIAKALSTNSPDERVVLMGKFPYMSPEAARFEGTDARSDIFSLGLVCYELLTGRMVYDVDSRGELMDKMTKFRIPNVRLVNADVPKQLNSIVMKAIAMEPEERFASAEEMGEELESYLYENEGAGPSNRTLAEWLAGLFPEARKQANW